MYVTRPLSLYLKNPSEAASEPPEGPNGGYLVLQDAASTPRHFFGLFKDSNIEHFLFPQNKLHVLNYGSGDRRSCHQLYFIPATNHPLSSNIYYAIKTDGKNKGKACTSSSDEEMTACCFRNCINDVDPKLLDPNNTYQQFVMVSKDRGWNNCGFKSKSVAHEAHPPYFLRINGWGLYSKTPKHFSLGEAKGMDQELRARLPHFNFPISYKASSDPVVVGKWYCPLMFVKEQFTPKEQFKKSMYYEMTLEQKWEQLFYCDNNRNEGSSSKNVVSLDVSVPNVSVMVGDGRVVQQEANDDDGVVWFKTVDGRSAGLSLLIVERMEWEEERVGWVSNEGNEGKVLKIDEFQVETWKRYGCYILVERFVLRILDGTSLLTCTFNHTHQIRSKWE